MLMSHIIFSTSVWPGHCVASWHLHRFAPTGFPAVSDGKESACNAGEQGSIPGLGRSPGGGHGNPTPVFLPGESSWTKESGGLQSMGSQRVGNG